MINSINNLLYSLTKKNRTTQGNDYLYFVVSTGKQQHFLIADGRWNSGHVCIFFNNRRKQGGTANYYTCFVSLFHSSCGISYYFCCNEILDATSLTNP